MHISSGILSNRREHPHTVMCCMLSDGCSRAEAHPEEAQPDHLIDQLGNLVPFLQARGVRLLARGALQLRGHLAPHRCKLLQHASHLVREQLHTIREMSADFFSLLPSAT
jgi:hypothetical protein